jgi:hypothetical protein
MEVRQNYAFDVGNRMSDRFQPRGQAVPRVLVVPSGIDENESAWGLHGIDERVAERVVGDGNRNLEDSIADRGCVAHGTTSLLGPSNEFSSLHTDRLVEARGKRVRQN